MQDIIVGIVIILCLLGIRSRTEGDVSYLSKEQSIPVRGVFALLIVMFHFFTDKARDIHVFKQITGIGYIIVAGFFFYSGYGMMKRYIICGEAYLKQYIKKHFRKIIIPYAEAALIFVILFIAVGNADALGAVMHSFVKGDPLVPYSWYIIALLIYHIVFYVLANTLKSIGKMIIAMSVIILALNIVMALLGYVNVWYSSTFAMIVGMLWAKYEDRLDALITYKYKTSLLISGLGCIVFFVLARIFRAGTVMIIMKNLAAVCFPAVMVILLKRFSFGNRLTGFLGTISFEIYLMQGIVLVVLEPYISNETVLLVLALVLTPAFAWVFKKGNALITNKLLMNLWKER